jgi:hypothetical protein
VDCWHHRIIYNANLIDPIINWKTLTEEIAGPHSIASNGNLYLMDDTGNHQVLVYKK